MGNITKLIKNQILYFILLLITLSTASAASMTIDELIASYDYDFSDGTLNITATDDYMLDIDSDSLNDTLIINLTSNATSGTYMAYVDLDDPNGKIMRGVNKTLSAPDTNFVINFSTSLLSKNKYNYTIRIEDSSDILIYEEHSIETNTYTGYEQGTNITLITDENLSNNHIQINLTLNVTVNETVNITVAMQYNDSYISSTEEKTLKIGIQTVSIKFDNETIKGTHYNGNFTIDSVTIGDKIIDKNQTTAIYDYETFAKTSYIKDYSDALIDTDNNSLSEFLEIKFTLNIKTGGSFNLEAELYDEFNNYISSINETETLSTGEQTIQARINGSEIYKTKINGPYKLSFAKLSIGNTTKDIVYNAYITNLTYYSDFERPPLPDLAIAMDVSYSGATNVTNITINITNNGQASAFNVFMDLFDNRTNSSFTRNESEAFLDIGQSVIYNYTASDTINGTLYTAIADFNNYVDESDESNNIVQNTLEGGSDIVVSSLQAIYSSGNLRVFEFIIQNNGASTISNINWSLNIGENNYTINSTIPINLTSGEDIYVYVEYNYSSSGIFTVIANATDGTQSGADSITIDVGDLVITSFDDIDIDGTTIVFEAIVQNNLEAGNLTGINWTLNADDGNTISADKLFNLTANETIFIYIEYQYGSAGTYNPTLMVFNPSESDSEQASVTTSSAPVISGLPDISFLEDSYNDTINLSNYVSDAEDADEDLVWSAVGNSSDSVIITILPNKIVNFTSAPDYNNDPNGINITFIVTDTSGLSDNNTISVTVVHQNDPPTFNGPIPNMIWPEDVLNDSLNLSNYFSDIDGDDLNYTGIGAENITVQIDDNKTIVNLTPNLNFNGLNYIMFSATDGNKTTYSNNITLNITPINDPPTFTGTIPKIEWPEDNVNSSLDLTQYFSDIDGDDLNYTSIGTENITVTINNNTGIVTLYPDGNFTGINYVVFYAYDPDGLSNQSNNVTLNVTPVNDAPTIDTYTPTNLTPTVAENSQLQFEHTSSDIDGDSLTYNWTLDNINKSSGSSWLYQPITGDAGIHNITLTVSDGELTASITWNVTVTNVTNLDVFDLTELYSEKTLRIFGFKINNTGATNLTNINWTLNTGLTTITANKLTNLSSGETIFVFAEYNYTQTGDYSVTASATDSISADEETISTEITDIELANLTVLNSSDTRIIFEFIIENTLTSNLTKVNWTLDTGLIKITADQLANLIPDEKLYVYVDYNYTQTGTYNVNATAINGSLIDSRNITINVP